ncbi:MAG: cysteine--tRNA ligase [Rhodospirillaceae bacterium]|jgi:cysteinyl-tRNA synthetase|nr:cysteine--tRNA ligase [Rhodospirillaceae bacterium]MBT4218934.1 cysteine--tRNA ligase [Rhodospirillaceae bacterium]MBT4463407.1 cysteine--tRNA ligase [Rhodospirillaceae bacterium]MBT5013145.1 cysteine--tRNA ligase [Rhodospirillaceae bacterium]MBT5307922.1 cysteine--tRNA ligase [Rhodospirillaceae bacterium]
MVLKLHNTLSRKKEDFTPLDADKGVRMYVCGPTVYDTAHIGNARPVVVFDVLFRLLNSLYPKVTYVRNITDVDDKINAKAAETGEDIRTITERTAALFHADMAALNTLEPDFEPRATDHIAEMQVMIADLIEKGFAYEAEGHVLFSVNAMDEYGKLSGHDRDQIIAGARVEVAPYKKDAADFVLWKPSTGEEPGWDSDWGFGRPGWHLECSAMSNKYLGQTFDIHGGGQDLIFPHHENEIAQSRCSHGTDIMARFWMHNGYLMAEGEKMSKSLGNFYTVNELLGEFPGEAIRLALLKTHYRQPMDFTKDGIADAKTILNKFYTALKKMAGVQLENEPDIPTEILNALCEDLNTPKALSELHQILNDLNSSMGTSGWSGDLESFKAKLLGAGKVLGLLQQDPEDWFKGTTSADDLDEAAIEALIAERLQARADKDFATSDRIRDELAEQGVVLEDGAEGTTWRRV